MIEVLVIDQSSRDVKILFNFNPSKLNQIFNLFKALHKLSMLSIDLLTLMLSTGSKTLSLSLNLPSLGSKLLSLSLILLSLGSKTTEPRA